MNVAVCSTWRARPMTYRKFSAFDKMLFEPASMIRIMLRGTFVTIGLMGILLVFSFMVGNSYVLPRLVGIIIALGYLVLVSALFTRRHHFTVGWMLIALYAVIGILVLTLWGLNAPVGVLILGFTIILTGIMLGARYIFATTLTITAVIFLLQYLALRGLIHPDTSGLDEASTLLDAFSYCIIFIIFSVVAWLAGRRSEQLLVKSQKAEAALQHEKNLLRIRLERKTREVRKAELEKVRELYRFAELGQLSTMLLHDLANNLTTITLDINDLSSKTRREESIARAKESISYLDTVVNNVRRQIHERDKPVVFEALEVIKDTIKAINRKARRNGVEIDLVLADMRSVYIEGDPVRLAHIVTILISNAIDAYKGTDSIDAVVRVTCEVSRRRLVLTVSDNGKGIDEASRSNIFQPFITTKADGMGIGLFMAHEMAEHHFDGSLILVPSKTETRFKLEIPVARPK